MSAPSTMPVRPAGHPKITVNGIGPDPAMRVHDHQGGSA
jgi:hypothetical protein